MAELDAKARNAIPKKEFAGPNRSYPIEDAAHAKNALGRAKQALNAGRLSESQYAKIAAKARKKLGRSMAQREAGK